MIRKHIIGYIIYTTHEGYIIIRLLLGRGMRASGCCWCKAMKWNGPRWGWTNLKWRNTLWVCRLAFSCGENAPKGLGKRTGRRRIEKRFDGILLSALFARSSWSRFSVLLFWIHSSYTIHLVYPNWPWLSTGNFRFLTSFSIRLYLECFP